MGQANGVGSGTEPKMTRALYRKNIRQWEQWSRAVAGLVMVLAALAVAPVLGKATLVGTGAFLIVTGFIGWCPACAAVGRTLGEKVDRAPR